jgi:hypothetical protein
MAKLILTEAEKSALTWMELDDATLGKVVKKTALSLKEHSDEQQKIWWFAAAMLLCGMAEDAKAAQLTHTIEGFSEKGVDRGDWRITVERLTPHSPAKTES